MINSPARHQANYTNSIHEFRKIIKKECVRKERYHNKLSLIIYEIGSNNEKDLIVRQFIRLMSERVRSMDDIGWFDISQIGVLLPHTPTRGAFRLSEDIANILEANPIPVPFTIYSYPSQRWPVKSRVPLFLNLRLALQKISRPHNITSSDDFRVYLSLEIDRAARYNYAFSLIIFHLNAIRTKGNPATLIAKRLNSRLRETDEIGWFGSEKIAAILPYAECQDCQKLVKSIIEDTSIDTDATYTIYTYPSNWPSEVVPSSLEVNHPPDRNSCLSSQVQNGRGQESNGRRTDPPPFTKNNQESTDQHTQKCNSGRKTPASKEIEHFFNKTIPQWKRGIDIVVASLSLVFFSPLFLFAAIGIWLTSPGPIFFKQTRVGYMQQQFSLFKFRTMHANAKSELHRKLMQTLIAKEGDKGNTKVPNDKRIFPFGRLLRKSSIDELPQLLNVLRGEMSLVGPRPCLPYEAKEYLRWHTKRFVTMPGLTGLWQVSGKNKLSFKQMIRLDISYERNLSLWLDIKILLKTVPAVISLFFDSSE